MAVTAQEKELTRAQPVQKSVSRTLMNLSGRTLIYAILILGAIPFIAPWLWMVSASFQPRATLFNWPPTWFPEHFTLENYKDFLEATGLFRWYVNSFFIAISVVVLQIFFNSLAGYTFAKRRFPGRDALFVFMLGTLMIPGWCS